MPAPTKRTSPKTSGSVRWSSPWTKANYTVLGIGVATIVLGFILLATGIGQWDNPLAVEVAPVVLVIGYCVIVPYAVIRYGGGDKPQDEQ